MIKFIGEWTPDFLEYLQQILNMLVKLKQLMGWRTKQMGEPQLATVEPAGDIKDTLEIEITDARTGKIISRKTY